MSRSVHWQPIIDRFSEKLSSWKAKNVSYGGRLTLVKSVLGSLPLYYFSLFRAPLKVINVLEGIRRQFFLGGAHGDSRKISWIAWDKVLSSSEFGGLNIGSLKALNWSLLAKWWWSFKTEKNSLWKKVVCSFNGSDRNLGVACDVGNELEKIYISFSFSFHKKIGSGQDTRFWTEFGAILVIRGFFGRGVVLKYMGQYRKYLPKYCAAILKIGTKRAEVQHRCIYLEEYSARV
ncbi:hypothetical protein Tco_1012328 [Tanacetum coccineum]